MSAALVSNLPTLAELEAEARRRGLLLRLQVRRPVGLLWTCLLYTSPSPRDHG